MATGSFGVTGGSPARVRDPRAAARHIGEAIRSIEASAQQVRRAVLELGDDCDQAGGPSCADLETLQPLLEEVLESHRGLLAGVGFVAAPGALRDAEHWMEWRVGRPGTYTRLEVSLDATTLTHYDYVHAAWFERPRAGDPLSLIGPYVDLGGVNQYIVTLTIPVNRNDQFLGVAGADILVDRVEGVLRRLTRAMGRGAIVLTDEARILASSVPRQHPGALVNGVDLSVADGEVAAPGLLAYHCGSLPWTLLVADPTLCYGQPAPAALLN